MMKQVKRFASLLLALVMALALAVPGLAAGETGSITINKAVPGETYKIYQIFTLESYNSEKDTYSYKIDSGSPWMTFLTNGGAGASYVTIDDQGYVTWKSDKSTDTDYAAFAKAALLYAQDTAAVTAAGSQEAPAAATGETTSTVTFSDLPLGYYLVDSSLGTLAILGSTNPDFAKSEKNEVPNVDKKVQEGSTGAYGDSNDANIGDEVTFQTTITVKGGARNYKLHDTMTGLTFTGIEKVQWKEATGTDGSNNYTYGTLKDVGADNYTVATTEKNDNNEDVAFKDGCAFELSFKQSFLGTLDTGDQIVVTYKAMVNANAAVGTPGNPNKTNLTYGNNQRTTDDTTTTYTYSFDLVKTKNDNTVLTGAKFALYPSETSKDPIKLVKVTDTENGDYYRVATNDDTGTITEIEAGKVTIKGLDSGTYYLEETQQPAGYNKLSGRQSFTIANANLDATMTGTDNNTWSQGGVQVINNTGSELPGTGGMGTTIFHVVGSILVIGAVVLFITKKRADLSGK